MAASAPRLLVVDDEPKICALLERAARRSGFDTRSLAAAADFVDTFASFRPLVVILDLVMPDTDGVELLRTIKDVEQDPYVVIISGMDPRTLAVAENLGQSHGLKMLGVLQKPIDIASLDRMLQSVIGVARAFTGDDIDRALRRNEFEMYYQPQISCDAGIWAIAGAEALVRWNHPTHGLILPGDFLPLIPEADLVAPFTEFVLESCISQLAEWSRAGTARRMSINVSAHVFDDLTFPDRLLRLVQHHGVAGAQVTLELTESAAMSDMPSAMDIFLRLRMNDINLSIDDFGTGYSSLKQLYQLPFHELKIDRTFVMNLPEDEQARSIVRTTILLAHSMNLSVCAEGVESRAALDHLQELNCDRAQGYLVSPAIPAADFAELARKWVPIRSNDLRQNRRS